MTKMTGVWCCKNFLFKSKYDPQVIYFILFYTDHTDFTD